MFSVCWLVLVLANPTTVWAREENAPVQTVLQDLGSRSSPKLEPWDQGRESDESDERQIFTDKLRLGALLSQGSSLDDLVYDLANDLWIQKQVHGYGAAREHYLHIQSVLEDDVKHKVISPEIEHNIMKVLRSATLSDQPVHNSDVENILSLVREDKERRGAENFM